MTETRTYDPIAATVSRLGLPGGDEFFLENIDFMRERYGDEITDTLRAAYAEHDLGKAEEFAALLVEDFSYKVTRNDDKGVEVEYSAAGGVEGRLSLSRIPSLESDLVVLAVVNAAEGIWSKARVKAKVDAEIAAEEAAANRP